MPQLVKGGKYIFGWSAVNKDGRIAIPNEAREEYDLKVYDKIFIIQGSKASKGFAITTKRRIKNSILINILKNIPALFNFDKLDNGYIEKNNKIYTWSIIDDKGYFQIDSKILNKYFVNVNDKLLVGRGSGFALAFIKTGMIVEEALKHSDLELFE
jgi:bifunctional DNA-binding transcriptional regulator/antitoxin component of YhaV-PrlF toxin-antitoxin module